MTATEVLDRLEELGVTAWPRGRNIRFQPASMVPANLKAQLTQHKAEILALLSVQHGDGQTPPLDRPPESELELRRLMDHLADPAAFTQWLERAMDHIDPAHDK